MVNLKFWQKKPTQPNNEEKLFPQKKFRNRLLAVGGIILAIGLLSWFFLVSPLLKLRIAALALQEEGHVARQNWQTKNLPELKNNLTAIEEGFIAADQAYRQLRWLKIVPIANNYYTNGQQALVAGDHALKAGDQVLEAISPYGNMLGFKTGEEGSEETTQDRIEFIMESSHSLAEKMDAIVAETEKSVTAINTIDSDYLPAEIRGQKIKEPFLAGRKTLNRSFSFLKGVKPVLENIPYFLGQGEERRYLVLFQNDTELRPTGGFLTAYAILNAHEGQFEPVLSEDIYQLDNRFNQRLEAPRPIEEYLPGVYYWHLRDMNLSPDFAKSMETFYQYYQEVPGTQTVDGIIAVDTHFLSDLVEVIGPVNVSDWGTFSTEPDERCWGCPQIIYELERMADKPSGEIRTDRKAIIGPLMKTILVHVMGAPSDQIPEIFATGLRAIEEKHILTYFPEEKYQQAVAGIKMTGEIEPAEHDYFHLNNTNFAGAKSNMFIDETVEQKIIPQEDGTIKRKVRVKYHNPKPGSDCNLERGELCLNGLYRNWFRFYVPSGSELIKMTGSEVEAKTYEELGKTVFEGFFGDKYPLHPNGGTSIVEIEYRLPFKWSADDYQLFIQKQPGSRNNLYQVTLDDSTKEFYLNNDVIVEW